MKMSLKKLIVFFVTLSVISSCAPMYLRNALLYYQPDIDDWKIFENRIVHNTDSIWDWKSAPDYNKHDFSNEDRKYIEEHETVAFLVIQNDSVKYEEYWDDWTPHTPSNIFSCTKSIVSLLVGIAIDEGYIKSVNQSIGDFIPAFSQAPENKITIRNLLTMSSGSSWSEVHRSAFSNTAKGYYGDNLKDIVMGLKSKEDPGKFFEYRSSDTQLLSYILNKATGKTLSQYAEEKLWKPIQAERPALWSLDKKDGDEKAFCCFNTNARDIARIARLILNKGKWNGKQIVSEKYIKEATTPAMDILNENKSGRLNYYGYQFWIINKYGQKIPYLRGLYGQLIYAIPNKNAIIVRLGHKPGEKTGSINEDVPRYIDIAYKMLN